MRDKKEQNLNLTLPERKESGDLMQEESFDDEPLIDAESAIELSELRNEIAKLRPQMELAAEDARKSATGSFARNSATSRRKCAQTDSRSCRRSTGLSRSTEKIQEKLTDADGPTALRRTAWTSSHAGLQLAAA